MSAVAGICVEWTVSNICFCSSTFHISDLYYPTSLAKLSKSISKFCTRVTNLTAEDICIFLGPSIRTDCSVTVLAVNFYTAFISKISTDKLCVENKTSIYEAQESYVIIHSNRYSVRCNNRVGSTGNGLLKELLNLLLVVHKPLQ